MKLGIVGYNEGNGHPYSFSAICNGYNDKKMRQFGWSVIADYLHKNDCNNNQLMEIEVSHVFCPKISDAIQIAEASNIPKVCNSYDDLISGVDGVIVARDDWMSHHDLTMPALKEGKVVFVDKPLTLSMRELENFKPYLETGQLSSCSGFRYSKTVEAIKQQLNEIGKIEKIVAITMNDIAKYGIHLIEVMASINPNFIKGSSIVVDSQQNSQVCKISNEDYQIELSVIEKGSKIFKIIFVGNKGIIDEDVQDNYYSFRSMLKEFHSSYLHKRPMFNPNETLEIVSLISKACNSAIEQNI